MSEVHPMRNRKPRQWCAGCGCCFGTDSPCRSKEKREWHAEVDDFFEDMAIEAAELVTMQEQWNTWQAEYEAEIARESRWGLEGPPNLYGTFIEAESGVYDSRDGIVGMPT